MAGSPTSPSEYTRLSKDKIMLWAAFTMCFFGFLRSGEICLGKDETFDPTRDITPQDIEVDNLENSKLLRLHLNHSKTDPYSEDSNIFVTRIYNEFYPVLAILAWLPEWEASKSGPLFPFQSSTPLTRSTFVIKFKEALSRAGIDPTRFADHSFRIGSTITACKAGITRLHNKTIEMVEKLHIPNIYQTRSLSKLNIYISLGLSLSIRWSTARSSMTSTRPYTPLPDWRKSYNSVQCPIDHYNLVIKQTKITDLPVLSLTHTHTQFGGHTIQFM